MESWQPYLSGAIGGILATWICLLLRHWIPTVCNQKSAATLLRENRLSIWLSNILFFAGIFGAIGVYVSGRFPENDWRIAGLGVGFSYTAPLVTLSVLAALNRRDPREAFVAYAISQQTPIPILYTLLVAGAVIFSLTLCSFVIS